MRETIIQKILDEKVIAIVRGVYDEDCVSLARALAEGGVTMLEVTFDQKSAEERRRTCNTIRMLVKELGDRMAFGAGTVTSVEMVEMTRDAGGQFVVSPDTNEEVIRATVAAGMVSIPGALTPTEVATAYAYGADFVKLFPAGDLGLSYIKSIRAPLAHIPMLAVGGVNEKNLGEFLSAGLSGVGLGSGIVNKKLIDNGDFAALTALAKQYTEQI